LVAVVTVRWDSTNTLGVDTYIALCTSVSVITFQIVRQKGAAAVFVTGIRCAKIVVITYHGRSGTISVSTLVVRCARIPIVAVQFIGRKYAPRSRVTGVVCAGIVVIAFNITAGDHEAASADALGHRIVAKAEVVSRKLTTGAIVGTSLGADKSIWICRHVGGPYIAGAIFRLGWAGFHAGTLFGVFNTRSGQSKVEDVSTIVIAHARFVERVQTARYTIGLIKGAGVVVLTIEICECFLSRFTDDLDIGSRFWSGGIGCGVIRQRRCFAENILTPLSDGEGSHSRWIPKRGHSASPTKWEDLYFSRRLISIPPHFVLGNGACSQVHGTVCGTAGVVDGRRVALQRRRNGGPFKSQGHGGGRGEPKGRLSDIWGVAFIGFSKITGDRPGTIVRLQCMEEKISMVCGDNRVIEIEVIQRQCEVVLRQYRLGE